MELQSAGRLDGMVTFMDLLLYMVIFSLTTSRVQGDSCPTSLPCMAEKSTSYGSFMPASNTPICDLKILMTLRTCCTPSDLGYRISVVLFCVILLTRTLHYTNPNHTCHKYEPYISTKPTSLCFTSFSCYSGTKQSYPPKDRQSKS